jgi:hypothetical protein
LSKQLSEGLQGSAETSHHPDFQFPEEQTEKGCGAIIKIIPHPFYLVRRGEMQRFTLQH